MHWEFIISLFRLAIYVVFYTHMDTPTLNCTTFTLGILLDNIVIMLNRITDKLEFVLFILRYVGGCLLFILGLKAPGISTLRDYVNFGGTINNQEEQDVSDDELRHWLDFRLGLL